MTPTMRIRTESSTAAAKAETPTFKWTEALKKRVGEHVLNGGRGVKLEKRPTLTGFHRTRVRVLPMTVGSRTTYGWYNPETRQVVRETVSTSRFKLPTTTTWERLSKLA